MLPSLHDDYLVSYEVNCEARLIRLCARRPEWKTEPGVRTIVFNGVEGYRFENDAFGNIIFALEAVPIEQFLSEYRSEIAESFRLAGSPGPWAADLDSAYQVLTARGVAAFVLSSSCGLSGWILAKDASEEPN
jgi:hypothetical protein